MWDIAPDDRPVEDWLALMRLLSGQEIDASGALRRLSGERVQELWTTLRTKYPQDFTVTPEQAFAWHRREAEACVKEKNGPAAVFHYYHSSWEWALRCGLPRP